MPIDEPNQPVIIVKDKALLMDTDMSVLLDGDVEVRLDLLPNPHIHMHFTNQKHLTDIEQVKLLKSLEAVEFFIKLGSNEREFKVYSKRVSLSNEGSSLILASYSEPIIGFGDNTTEIHHIVFHLFNFKDILGMSSTIEERTEETGRAFYRIHHVNLKTDNWVIELRSVVESGRNFKKLENEGGYGLTHIGCLKKIDDKTFSGREAEEMLADLGLFFSFAKGVFCKPICAVGFDSFNNRVWESWSSPKKSWSNPTSWFNKFHPEQLENLFSGFIDRLTDTDLGKSFRESIYWYLNANDPNQAAETRIILTQCALELLSFVYLTQKLKSITVKEFKRNAAAKNYRLFFSSLKIPVDISNNYPELKVVAKKFDWGLDAPHAITEVRNALIHPDKKTYGEFEAAVVVETLNLSLWFLELSILRLCGYSEPYNNRILF